MHNTDKVCREVVKMVVGGEAVAGNLIPAEMPGETYELDVCLRISSFLGSYCGGFLFFP